MRFTPFGKQEKLTNGAAHDDYISYHIIPYHHRSGMSGWSPGVWFSVTFQVNMPIVLAVRLRTLILLIASI